MAKKSVLIVDEDAPYRQVLRALLERERFAVAEAAHGREGVRRFQQTHPDLLILAESLSDLDIMQILDRVRFIRGDVGIIMLGTQHGQEQLLDVDADGDLKHADDESWDDAARVRPTNTSTPVTGVDCYLLKPFSAPELMACVFDLTWGRVWDAGSYS